MIFRDIEELKIWGNDNGFRFHRDPDDKTKYKVYFTDDDIDKLESFVRQQQAEIIALNEQIREKDVCLKLLANEIEALKAGGDWLKNTFDILIEENNQLKEILQAELKLIDELVTGKA